MMEIEVTQYVGVDISYKRFSVYVPEQGHSEYHNSLSGYRSFIKTLSADSWVVMEATGSYHQGLARYLHQHGTPVSVVNPLVIKRYIQMKLRRNKTDKADAQMIASYGCDQPLEAWAPEADHVVKCRDLHGTVRLYIKHSTALKNRLHSLEAKGEKTGPIVRSLKRQLSRMQVEISRLDKEMEELMRDHDREMMTHLTSVPGLGRKTALLLITLTNGFRNFESAKQVSAYLGLAPTERKSGSSIRGRGYISKAGNQALRNHLFMCSFTACEYNPQCAALYNRLVAKGKSKKLALIAVCNKLLRQAFAVAKSRMPYDPEYRSVLVGG